MLYPGKKPKEDSGKPSSLLITVKKPYDNTNVSGNEQSKVISGLTQSFNAINSLNSVNLVILKDSKKDENTTFSKSPILKCRPKNTEISSDKNMSKNQGNIKRLPSNKKGNRNENCSNLTQIESMKNQIMDSIGLRNNFGDKSREKDRDHKFFLEQSSPNLKNFQNLNIHLNANPTSKLFNESGERININKSLLENQKSNNNKSSIIGPDDKVDDEDFEGFLLDKPKSRNKSETKKKETTILDILHEKMDAESETNNKKLNQLNNLLSGLLSNNSVEMEKRVIKVLERYFSGINSNVTKSQHQIRPLLTESIVSINSNTSAIKKSSFATTTKSNTKNQNLYQKQNSKHKHSQSVDVKYLGKTSTSKINPRKVLPSPNNLSRVTNVNKTKINSVTNQTNQNQTQTHLEKEFEQLKSKYEALQTEYTQLKLQVSSLKNSSIKNFFNKDRNLSEIEKELDANSDNFILTTDDLARKSISQIKDKDETISDCNDKGNSKAITSSSNGNLNTPGSITKKSTSSYKNTTKEKRLSKDSEEILTTKNTNNTGSNNGINYNDLETDPNLDNLKSNTQKIIDKLNDIKFSVKKSDKSLSKNTKSDSASSCVDSCSNKDLPLKKVNLVFKGTTAEEENNSSQSSKRLIAIAESIKNGDKVKLLANKAYNETNINTKGDKSQVNRSVAPANSIEQELSIHNVKQASIVENSSANSRKSPEDKIFGFYNNSPIFINTIQIPDSNLHTIKDQDHD